MRITVQIPTGKTFASYRQALKRLKSQGFKLIIITNQSGIGRGFFSLEQYRAVEAEILRQLGNDLVDATYFCPHLPDNGCDCRKPAAGMILQAAREHRVDLRRSFLIGDKESDARAGGMRVHDPRSNWIRPRDHQ
jgi:D-glycero-D-manno-heptose 1,7-bisphosphate phosphatase